MLRLDRRAISGGALLNSPLDRVSDRWNQETRVDATS
jgi:hypothetical protein